MARLYVVMGVAGSGKSSVGEGLAVALGGTYIDGDDYHPQSNIDKMSSGLPLTDEDRWPWLQIVAQELAGRTGIVLIGCSALKRSYRNFITQKAEEAVTFIHLAGSKELIAKRMAARTGHFMPTGLLDSQFATLESPDEDENAMTVDITPDRQTVIADLARRIKSQMEKQSHD